MTSNRIKREAAGKIAFLTTALLCTATGVRAQTAAGTPITNQASYRATVDGVVREGTSNVATIVVTAESAGTLVKRQSVRAPDGSDAAVSGAIVTYTLVATLPAGGGREARVEDPVPAGTSYVAGSLTLDGARLSDAADGDAGDCDGRLVSVALADTPLPHTVTFQIRLP